MGCAQRNHSSLPTREGRGNRIRRHNCLRFAETGSKEPFRKFFAIESVRRASGIGANFEPCIAIESGLNVLWQAGGRECALVAGFRCPQSILDVPQRDTVPGDPGHATCGCATGHGAT
jgi:hypothetical protein